MSVAHSPVRAGLTLADIIPAHLQEGYGGRESTDDANHCAEHAEPLASGGGRPIAAYVLPLATTCALLAECRGSHLLRIAYVVCMSSPYCTLLVAYDL